MCSRKRQGVLPSRFMDGMKLAQSESLRSIAARTSKYTYQVISKSRNIRGRTGSGRKKIYESVSRNGEFRVRAGNDGAALLSIATLRPSWKTLIEEAPWADQPARRNVSGTRRRLLWLRSPLVAETRCHWMIAPVCSAESVLFRLAVALATAVRQNHLDPVCGS